MPFVASCRQARKVNFRGTRKECREWIERKKADTVVQRIDALKGDGKALPFTWDITPTAEFRNPFHDQEEEDYQNRHTGEDGYLGGTKAVPQVGQYEDPTIIEMMTDDPFSWLA